MINPIEQSGKRNQTGIALVVSLLFLLVVTIISIAAATNSSLGLKMSSNLQDSYQSFQAAEAGIYAALGLAGTANDPFDVRDPVVDPNEVFNGVTPHPLRNIALDPNDPTTVPVEVSVFLIAAKRDCPRPPGERGGSSVDTFDCDYYRITSEHNAAGRARSQVELGVVKTVAGSGGG